MKFKPGLLFIIFAFLALLTACEKTDEIPKTGQTFGRAQNIQFYFSDASGNDLLDLKNNKILPVTYNEAYNIPAPPAQKDSLNYYYDGGSIRFDRKNGRYFWNSIVYGEEGYKKHQFYIRISESDIDTIRAEFRYSTGAMGGNGVYAHINKLTYSGIVIRKDEDTPAAFTPEHIYITKAKQKTSIKFTPY